MLNENDELENTLESILFVSGQGVEIKDICDKLETTENDVKSAIESLKQKLAETGINVITYKNSVQLCSNPKYADQIATVLNPIKEKLLTKAAMETAAIVAYKQPVTRLDIEQIRGVSSDYALQVLLNFKLVEVVGRKDAIGKPLLFGTTDEFLKRFELQSINDLPDYDELLERIAVLHKKAGDELYGSTEIIDEDELPDDELEDEDSSTKPKSHKTEETENNLELSQNSTENESCGSENDEISTVQSDNNQQKNDKDDQLDEDKKENVEESKTEIIFSEEETKEILEWQNNDDVLGSKDSDLL
jgi:segregation and condensation protein B